MKSAKDVDAYLAAAPTEVRARLRAVRAAIRRSAPHADENISYGTPFYSYPGEVGVKARLCYFGYRKSDITFYMRPRDLEPHMERVARYMTAKSALRFRAAEPLPVRVLERLVRDAVRRHAAAGSAMPARKTT